MKYHFIGIGGIGMSAIAQYFALKGNDVSGSDRMYDSNPENIKFNILKEQGIKLYQQDGSKINNSIDRIVITPAIEMDNPDKERANELGIKICARTEVLAGIFNDFTRKIAVSGTSGKTTVTAMIVHCLNELGCDVTAFVGGFLNNKLKCEGLGNVCVGQSDICVIEADESDGRLELYKPSIGVITSLSNDHLDIEKMKQVIRGFSDNVEDVLIVNGDIKSLNTAINKSELKYIFGLSDDNNMQAKDIKLYGTYVKFYINGVSFRVNGPGIYTVMNALAACCVVEYIGFSLEKISRVLKSYKGVKRRFDILGEEGGVTVVDDYAHNPEKIYSAITAAKINRKRIMAVFQPHGYAPTKMMWSELVETFAKAIRVQDVLIILDVYYAGGTVDRSFSSSDIAAAVLKENRKLDVNYCHTREEALSKIKEESVSGDLILIMGARDETLSDYAADILKSIKYR
ncbi:MAG: UDP-N-acetylmuramate--L-alanine ligase [Candidatus Theseobacter exili]|nr:UDP-N-acetylmuramate--L-alanine ligase [Candidatus Theseobacter exili]